MIMAVKMTATSTSEKCKVTIQIWGTQMMHPTSSHNMQWNAVWGRHAWLGWVNLHPTVVLCYPTVVLCCCACDVGISCKPRQLQWPLT